MGDVSSRICKNNLSASRSIKNVSTAIAMELDRGHTSGPFLTSPFSNFRCPPWEQFQRIIMPLVLF